jgi:microcystin degradation protein MlrC
MALRVYGGGIQTETNVFSPIPTGLGAFVVVRPGDDLTDVAEIAAPFERFARIAAARGAEYVQGTFAVAAPGGVTTRPAYESLRSTLLDEVAEALPLDAVLLSLHGAMAAEGYEDCETDVVERVRELVGANARIGVVLDLHCDLPARLLEVADVVVTYKEYPHVDIEERADEVAALTLRAAAGEIDPRIAGFDCRMMGMYATGVEPMRGFVSRLKEAERRPGVLSVSLGHGFPWGDAPEMGAKVIVTTDGGAADGPALAEELGRDFFALRREVTVDPLPLQEALDRALAPGGHRPVVVADVADNAGGGAPGDSTFALRALLEREARNAVVAPLADPIVVSQAFAAGVGARLAVRLGGKLGPTSGAPLDLSVEVRGLAPDLVQRWPQTTGHLDSPCGDAAWLRCDGVDVVVTTHRTQFLGLELLTAFGIDPAALHAIVAKSSNHFRAALEPVAGEILYASTPGALSFDFRTVPYRLTDTNRYPLVDDPWQ